MRIHTEVNQKRQIRALEGQKGAYMKKGIPKYVFLEKWLFWLTRHMGKNGNLKGSKNGVCDPFSLFWKYLGNIELKNMEKTEKKTLSNLRINTEQKDRYEKIRCPVCGDMKNFYEMTISDDLIAQQLCETCYSKNPKKGKEKTI